MNARLKKAQRRQTQISPCEDNDDMSAFLTLEAWEGRPAPRPVRPDDRRPGAGRPRGSVSEPGRRSRVK